VPVLGLSSLTFRTFLHFVSLRVLLARAADELDAAEDVDAAGQEHGEAAHAHVAVGAGGGGRAVPLVEVPTPAGVVHVVEEAVLGHQERVALEGPGCAARVEWKEREKVTPSPTEKAEV